MKLSKYFLLPLLFVFSCFLRTDAQAHAPKLGAQSTCLTEVNWQKMPEHPRLFANNARIASLKLQNDEVSNNLLFLLKNDAEKTLLANKIVYPTGTNFKFGAVRNVQGRILSLALSYRIFGDKRYLERAKAELMQLAELPDWCPTHFLDVGEAALAAGVGLDWLYNDLTAAEREKVAQAIVKNAIIPSLDAKESDVNKSWLNGNFNWNPVCNGGLLVGALAIAEREPVLSRQIVERSIKYLPYAGAAYAPDGTYAEGPGYWSYGTTFHIVLVEALRSVFGTTCDLEKFEGFLKTTDFISQVVGPTGHPYNFSDADSRLSAGVMQQFTSEPIMLWFAREKKSRDAASVELNSLAKAKALILADTTGKSRRNLSRHLAFEVLWWDAQLPPLSKSNPNSLHWTAGGHLPLAVMRSAWGDTLASFIAIKGGTPDNSHGHMDVGSFILEANGVRWALDLGGESYDKMRAAKLDLWNYSQNSDRWTTFRTGPEGHNILRFNNARQDIVGLAEIQELPTKKGIMGNVVNLTSLYKSQMEKVTRTVKLHPNRSISIEDEWTTTASNNVDVTFQWLTAAKATLKPDGVLLEQHGKSLMLKVKMAHSKALPEIVIEDVSKAKNLQDSDNPGLSRIIICVKTPAKSTSGLVVTAIPSSTKK